MAGAKPVSSASSRPHTVREDLGQPQGRFLRARPLWAKLDGAEACWGWPHNGLELSRLAAATVSPSLT
jgi:hypothetical protein